MVSIAVVEQVGDPWCGGLVAHERYGAWYLLFC